MSRTISQLISRETTAARLESGSRRPRNSVFRTSYHLFLFHRVRPVRDSYWDWAEPRVEKEGLPPVLYEEKLTITVAGGRTTKVNNPFAYYTYQAPIPSDVENKTTEVCFKRTYFWGLLMVFFCRSCRPMKLHTFQFGSECIDMPQVVHTPTGVTSKNFKSLHHLSVFA